jgi:hypothetical protein
MLRKVWKTRCQVSELTNQPLPDWLRDEVLAMGIRGWLTATDPKYGELKKSKKKR